MDTFLNVVLYGCVFFIVIGGAFASYMQATTLFIGKKIALQGMEDEMPRGFQDAITPKVQDIANTILPASYIAILILGSLQSWYFGILLLTLSFVGMAIFKKFIPNKLNFYLKIVMYFMANKVADYAKSGDVMRVEAARDVLDNVGTFYLQVKDQDMTVPSFDEIKQMPLGY